MKVQQKRYQAYLDFFNDPHCLQFSGSFVLDAHIPAAKHFICVRVKIFTTFLYVTLLKYLRSTEKKSIVYPVLCLDSSEPFICWYHHLGYILGPFAELKYTELKYLLYCTGKALHE